MGLKLVLALPDPNNDYLSSEGHFINVNKRKANHNFEHG